MKKWKIWLSVAITLLIIVGTVVCWWAWANWATFCAVVWYGFLIVTTCTVVAGTIALLHPLDFTIKGRLTPRGQRGEVLFSYAFGLFGLGATASPGIQKVWVRLGRKEWPLWKNLRDRPKKSSKKPEKPTDGDSGGGVFPGDALKPAPSQPFRPPTGNEKTGQASAFPVGEKVPPPASANEERPIKHAPKPQAQPLESETSISPVDTIATGHSQSKPDSRDPEPKSTPVFDSARIDGFKEVDSPPIVFMGDDGAGVGGGGGNGSGGSADGGRADGTGGGDDGKDQVDGVLNKLKRWRRTLAKWRMKIREGWKISRNMWRRFSPILWRLGANLWATVSLLGPRLWVRHGVEAPEITGMLHGLASTLGGIARSFGASFEAVPVFCVQTIYLKGDVGVSVSSWKSMYCVLRFLCERELWKGSLDLYRWHRDRKV